MKRNDSTMKFKTPQELITEKELGRRLKVSSGTLRGWRYLGIPHYNLNPMRGFRPTIRYNFEMVMHWIEERFLQGKK